MNTQGEHAVPASARLLARDAASMPLTRASEPGSWVDGGWPSAATEVLDSLAGVKLAIWEITTGVVTDIETDEVLVVLAGAGVVRFDGEAVELGPGTVVRLHCGEHAEWTIVSPVRAVTVSALER